jgi:addiction module HigA family antidote
MEQTRPEGKLAHHLPVSGRVCAGRELGGLPLKKESVMKALRMKNPPHPGFSVRVDCLEAHGLSVTEGAKILGVSRSALSHLVNESADLSWDMAIRLAKAFGSTPEGWMRLQFQCDAAQVEERSKKIKVKTFAANPVHA